MNLNLKNQLLNRTLSSPVEPYLCWQTVNHHEMSSTCKLTKSTILILSLIGFFSITSGLLFGLNEFQSKQATFRNGAKVIKHSGKNFNKFKMNGQIKH